jgi:hypothetical protein
MHDSAFGRLAAVLWSPGKVFESIAARPTWAVALLAFLLTVGASIFVTYSRVTPEDVVRVMEERDQQLPPGWTPERMHTVSQWGASVAGPPLFGLALVVGAAIVLVSLRVLGSEIDFVRTWSVFLHGVLPLVVAALITIPVVLGRASVTPEEAEGGQILASSLALLADEGTNKYVRQLLVSVDLFSIWSIALLTLGYRVVGRVSRGTALGVVLTVWALGILCKLGLTALSPG